jgi:carbonic anhydrase
MKRQPLTAERFQDVGKGPESHAGEFIEWLTIRDREQIVRDDVKRIREHPLVPKNIAIHGYVYDVKSGGLLEVPEAQRPAEAAAA